ncbi:hypothetical protein CTI12_AA138400 [Artemisia annua]|uniref:Uncharacterized protein n=1 Tax=Artemisia annua TaxID=35608 RepID=A0A2U1PLS5_ARTAN|nr:hypothetical protein CTI12_AA138400 [Artemisia annua]
MKAEGKVVQDHRVAIKVDRADNHKGGRGWVRKGPPPQGRGGVAPQQYPGGQPQQQQHGRGGGPQQQKQAPRGITPSQHGAGSGPVFAPTPELHQATQAP